MLKIENLSFSFPEKDLFDNVSFNIESGEKCAFIGASGSGKSTLASMIIDIEKLVFDGKIIIENQTQIGYISQFYQLDFDAEITVFDYISSYFNELQDKIVQICDEMSKTDEVSQLMENYTMVMDEFDALDGENFENNINKKLGLANLTTHANLPVSKLSGGEFKLVQVIKEMLTNPNFIVMDEPDAFLDFDNINSLKKLINSHKGTLFVITHSRYLLNHCFNKIIHLENKKINQFQGNYIDYNFELLQEKIEMQELAFEDTEEIERNEMMIERLRDLASKIADPSKGRSLKARVKIQERLEARRIKGPFISIKEPKLELKTDLICDCEEILNIENFNFSFENELLNDVNFSIKPCEKVAIIGANGTGKTTLLREIFKNSNNSIKIDPNAKISYLSQQQNEMLNDENTVFDEFFDAGLKTYQEITDFLAKYGFESERMNQKIQEFSGGEKNILQLAKIASTNSNFLLLDEPTSHLDTYSQIALEKAINNYNGTVLMVSHDFYSIVNCVDYVIIIENKTARKMQIRKFRKTIYAKHFDCDYLKIEQDKKAVEIKIEKALHENDFEKAKNYALELEEIIKLL